MTTFTVATAVAAAATASALPPALQVEERVKHLFRLSTRRCSIHPLQHLVLRYRRGERG